MSRVMVISDLQIPFENENALEYCKALKEKYEPDYVVQIGDLLDNHFASSFTKETEAPGAMDEISRARETIKAWGEVFPKMTILMGNHEDRLMRALHKVGLPSSLLKTIPEIFQFPKQWELVDQIEIDNVLYVHNSGVAGVHAVKNIAKTFSKSVVQGHLHTVCGIEYAKTLDGLRFAMVVGCLIDNDASAFNYSKGYALRSMPISAVGFVDDGKHPWLEVIDV